jgi:hypothetical protein
MNSIFKSVCTGETDQPNQLAQSAKRIVYLLPQWDETLEDDQSDGPVVVQEPLQVELSTSLKKRPKVGQRQYFCADCQKKIEKHNQRKMRFCEYTGKLFCTKCHINDVSVIPARVLKNWDFKRFGF